MKGAKSKLMLTALVMSIALGFTGNAMAVTSADTSVSIEEPDENAEVSVGSFGGVPYEVEVSLEDTAENDSVVDTDLTLNHDGSDYVVELDDVTLEPGETHTYSGDSSFGDYEYPTDDEEHDVSLTADAEYTDQSDDSTVESSDTTSFSVVEGLTVGLIILGFVGLFLLAFARDVISDAFN